MQHEDLFFADLMPCNCGHKLSMKRLIGYQEDIHKVKCPQCGVEYDIYANLEVEYCVMPKEDLKLSALGIGREE